MIEQEQRVVDDTAGDCFAACLASILEVPLEQVPNPHGHDWMHVLDRWLWETRRLAAVLVHADDTKLWSYPGKVLAIASIPSAMFEGKTHAVVWDLVRGEVRWDPSPTRDARGGEYPKPLRFWLLAHADAPSVTIEEESA